MADADDVRRLALALPHVSEIESDGFDFRVADKGFVWSYPERRPGRPRRLRADVAVLFVGDEAEKQALLLGEPDVFFTTPGYDGLPLVMLRLVEVDVERLEELVTDAWRMRAPAALVGHLDRSDDPSGAGSAGGRATLMVVTGVPGAGKTTLGLELAKALGVPFVSLDSIKESLYSTDAWSRDRHELRLAAEVELVVQLDAVVGSVVVDIWIAPERDTDRITTLLRKQRRDIVELVCRVPADVAVERYAGRQRSGPHRPADASTLHRIQEAVEHFEPMGIGRCIEIDTSRPVDIDGVVARLHP